MQADPDPTTQRADAPLRRDLLANPFSDESLMTNFRAGNADAFTILYDRHERAAWRFIRQRLGVAEREAADDLLQETWIEVASAAPDYVPESRFIAWLFDVGRTRVLDHLRATGAGADVDVVESVAGRSAAPAEPAAPIGSRAQAEAFLAAIDRLPALQSEAFVLHAEGGLDIDEVAHVTRVSTGVVQARLAAAHAGLHATLASGRSA